MIRLSLGLVFFPVKNTRALNAEFRFAENTGLPQQLRGSGTSQPCAAQCQACPSLVEFVHRPPLSLSLSLSLSLPPSLILCMP